MSKNNAPYVPSKFTGWVADYTYATNTLYVNGIPIKFVRLPERSSVFDLMGEL